MGGGGVITERVRAAYRRIAELDRPEVWTTLRAEAELLAEAKEVQRRVDQGERLALAGRLLAVKDNIDVAGVPTTAGCPSFGYIPAASATAVSRLTDAGALVIGKTNMDQFATGLVGTRSPYGIVRHASLPGRIAGGSSSGSAVAVALGIADFALGTDTAGSGRVPAALHGLVGLKPTLGLVPTTGVVPAARSYDCVSVFASTLREARDALAPMIGPDPLDVTSRDWPADTRLAARPAPQVAVPDPAGLAALSSAGRAAFAAAAARLARSGARLVEVDVEPFLAAARLLYDGALVAERYAAVGEFLSGAPPDADPTVAAIVLAGAAIPAHRLVADRDRLAEYRHSAAEALAGSDALLLPTTTGHPSIAEVLAEPVASNSRMGVYTNFVNLLDMAAVAVPAGWADGGPFGVSVITRAFDDQVGIDLASRLTGEPLGEPLPAPGADLVVFGAHLAGQPLNHQLTDLGARLVGPVRTAPEYRMVALPGDPPRPGVLRVAAGGVTLPGERWRLAPAALGRFLAGLTEPMSLGPIRLADGRAAIGFHCDPVAAAAGSDISGFGGWLAYRTARVVP
jgi:allophanate hydrolase